MSCSQSVISPFRGIRYHTTGSGDLSSRMAPPYDVISESMQGELYARDEHNFVRVELPKPPVPETEQENRYTRAAATMQEWLSRGLLIRDHRPSLYVLEQEFDVDGRTWRRRGVFAALRLPEEGDHYVLSHEGTLAAPKADRLRLMQACAAMTSPIMVMSADRGSQLLSRLHQVSGQPGATAVDLDRVIHRLWVVEKQADIDAVCAAIGRGPLFIADGHHRFETAITCRDGMRKLSPGAPADASFNYALSLVTSARDEALKILPTHRLVSGLGADGLEQMRARMRNWFEAREASMPDADDPKIGELLASASGDHVFAAISADGRTYLLTAREKKLAPSASVTATLDVSVLHRYLIDPVIAASGSMAKTTYLHDARRAVQAVANKECDFAFFLRPASVSDVLGAAIAGERMPQKSTFFHPKAPAGLVVSSLGAEPV